MKVVKAVTQPYVINDDLNRLFSNFRRMTNYCIKVGVEKDITSRNGLGREVYKTLSNDREGLHSWYVLGAFLYCFQWRKIVCSTNYSFAFKLFNIIKNI